MMLWKGLVHVGPRPARAADSAATSGSSAEFERVAGQRSGQVLEPVLNAGVQCGRTGHVLLDHQIGKAGRSRVQAVRRGDSARLEGIATRLAQGHEAVVAMHVGEVEPRHPFDGGQRILEGIEERTRQGGHLGLAGSTVEPADLHIDGVDGPPADRLHDAVAHLLQREAPLEVRPVQLRHLHRILAAEEIGGMEHVDVQRVTLHPFTAIEEATQVGDSAPDTDPQGILHRGAGAHLVRHRADAADAGGEVRCFGRTTSPQKGLEEPGRLEDLQLHVLHTPVANLDAQRPLALDARQSFDRDRAPALIRRCHGAASVGAVPARARSVTA